MNNEKLNEPVLEDDYPVYPTYAYVIDGEVKLSTIEGTVADFKRAGVKEVRRCDIVGRELAGKPIGS